MEQWKNIWGYSNYYQVSDRGRIRSLDRVIITSQGKRNLIGKILTPSSRSDYPFVTLCKCGQKANKYVHSLVLRSFRGVPTKGKEACHNDGNRANNCLSNLRWATSSSNKLDTVKHGRANNIPVERSDGCIFKSALSASKISSCNPSHITAVCRNKRQTAGGWGWKYAGP